MDKRVTKITIISTLVNLVIIVLVMGGFISDWFGIDLGVFKWIIFSIAVTVNSCIAADQARKVSNKN